MAEPTHDVAIVGYGPTGMTLAALLGRAGHSVVVLERYPGLYNLPRAACFDDEIMRTFQKLGVSERGAPRGDRPARLRVGERRRARRWSRSPTTTPPPAAGRSST